MNAVLMLPGLLVISAVLVAILDRAVGRLADRQYMEYE